MLLIARRTALAAALLLVMPSRSGFPGGCGSWTAGCHVEKPVVGDGNGDPAVGNYHSCRALRLVPLVSALSAARGVDPVPHPCRRYPGGTGAKSPGQGAGPGAETVRHLAGKHKAGAGDAILRVKA